MGKRIYEVTDFDSSNPNQNWSRNRYDIASMSDRHPPADTGGSSSSPWRLPRPVAEPRSPQRDAAGPLSGRWGPVGWAVVAAFGTYFCMYAFRKPFGVSTYDGVDAWGWHYKTVAVAAQVIGYTLSKFVGIKVLTEMPPERRAVSLIGLILLAEAALVGFGMVPPPLNIVFLFLNGLPLGMVFGLVLSFLEGRRQTEALAAGLCTSFIVADGVTKSVGKWMLERQVSDFWMPAAVGAVFFLPLLFFVWMLTRTAPPNAADVEARSERPLLTPDDRRRFIRRYAWGLIPLMLMYLLVTVVRSVRSDFAPEIWIGLGVETTPELFSYSEIWVGLLVTLSSGISVLIIDNRRALRAALNICIVGFVVLLLATLGQMSGAISPFAFMVLIGVGLYLPYVATHTTIFERFIALTRDTGNVVFLMYLADAIGYLGYVGVMLVRNSVETNPDFIAFFRPLCFFVAVVSLCCMAVSSVFLVRVSQAEKPVAPDLA